MLGMPQIVVPCKPEDDKTPIPSNPIAHPVLRTVAQLPYKSRITKTVEYRPVCVSLMGSKGKWPMMQRLHPKHNLPVLIT